MTHFFGVSLHFGLNALYGRGSSSSRRSLRAVLPERGCVRCNSAELSDAMVRVRIYDPPPTSRLRFDTGTCQRRQSAFIAAPTCVREGMMPPGSVRCLYNRAHKKAPSDRIGQSASGAHDRPALAPGDAFCVGGHSARAMDSFVCMNWPFPAPIRSCWSWAGSG